MTPEDFRWVLNERLMKYFPELAKYVGSLPDETKAAWAEQFQGVEREDLVEACQEIVRGHESINRYEYEQLASKLLASCRRIAEPRYRREQTRRSTVEGDRGGSLAEALGERLKEWGLGPALREWEARVAEGEDYDTVGAEILGAIERGER